MKTPLVKFNDQALPLYTTRGMVHGGLLYDTKSTEGANGLRFLHIRDGNLPLEEERDRFDPMAYIQQHGHDTLKTLRFYIDNIDNPKMTPWTAKREGALAVHSVGDPNSVINSDTYDFSRGCNIVLQHDKDPHVERTAKSQFVETGGVYLPSLVEI